MRLVWCRRCTAGFTIIAGYFPNVCPSCTINPAQWTTMAPVSDEPRRAWELTPLDRRLLHSFRIASEA
jgi:hypothetical protein